MRCTLPLSIDLQLADVMRPAVFTTAQFGQVFFVCCSACLFCCLFVVVPVSRLTLSHSHSHSHSYSHSHSHTLTTQAWKVLPAAGECRIAVASPPLGDSATLMQRARASSLHSVETIGVENIIAGRVLLQPNAAGAQKPRITERAKEAKQLH